MKLQALNAAIDAAPAILARFSFGPVELKKGSLKDALRASHGGQRTAETGLCLAPGDGGQFLTWEQPRLL